MYHNLIYRLEGFQDFRNRDIHGHSFNIYLDSEFAKKLLLKEVPEKYQRRINEIGKEIIQRIEPTRKFIEVPYVFHGNTLLSRVIRTWGDSCELGLDGDVFEKLQNGKVDSPITYFYHNIGYERQKINLLYLFVNWIDLAETLID